MRQVDIRAWNKYHKKMYDVYGFNLNVGMFYCESETGKTHTFGGLDLVLMQFTGLHDKNGKKIYEGDILNIFFTSSDGEHIHDCLYKASIGKLGDINFNFWRLLWEDYGHNQYPSSTTLCERYDTLGYEYDGEKLKLKVPDSWGENHFHGNKWKRNDKSFYFEIVGNIHQDPELLES